MSYCSGNTSFIIQVGVFEVEVSKTDGCLHSIMCRFTQTILTKFNSSNFGVKKILRGKLANNRLYASIWFTLLDYCRTSWYTTLTMWFG